MGGIKILTFFLVGFMLTQCKCKQQLERVVERRDSLVTKDSIVYREKLVYSPVDSAKIRAQVKCPDVPKTTVKSKHATASFEIKDGVAKVDCLCDSTAIKVREYERYKEALNKHHESEKSKAVVEKRYVPKWIGALAGIGIFALLYLIYKLIKLVK